MLLSAPRDIGCTDLRQTQCSNDISAANHICNCKDFNANRNKQLLNELFKSRTEAPEDSDYGFVVCSCDKVTLFVSKGIVSLLLKKCKFKQY